MSTEPKYPDNPDDDWLQRRTIPVRRPKPKPPILPLLAAVLVAAAILFSIVFYGVKEQIQASNGPSMAATLQTFRNMQTTENNMQVIQRAMTAYNKAKQSYPPNLPALVPKYLTSSKYLHSPLDKNTNLSHVSYTYACPSANAPLDTVFITIAYDMPMHSGLGSPGTEHVVLRQPLSGPVQETDTFPPSQPQTPISTNGL